MQSRENEKSSSHAWGVRVIGSSKQSKWVGRECNSAIMGDGLLVIKTKNRSETVVLKSIQCFGHRYIVFFFQTCQAISDYRMVELLIEAKKYIEMF